MNYMLSVKEIRNQIVDRLYHSFGVSPENATDEHYYKAVTLVLGDMMSRGRTEKPRIQEQNRSTISAWNSSWDAL